MRIALLVQIPYRDLPGLVLTAMYLCHRGATCYLVPWGHAKREIWPLMPDFVLLPQLRRGMHELARQLHRANIKVGVLDNEGAVFPDLEYYKRSIGPDPYVRYNIACFCSWGPKLAEYVIEKSLYQASQVTVTGCPRFDFYAHPWRKAALEASPYVSTIHKYMVLINGNFPLANHIIYTPEELVEIYSRDKVCSESEVLYRQQVTREGMLRMVELTNHLAARFAHVDFVYRPHPVERLEPYLNLLDSTNNLHLTKEGTVDGWIIRASAVIQRSCSTAIDACLAGVPALSPVWIPKRPIIEVAENVSIPCKTEEELINQIDAALEGRLTIPNAIRIASERIISDWFHNTDGKAHERVGDCIIDSLQKNGEQVKQDLCRDRAYGLPGPDAPLKNRIIKSFKMKVGIPVNWSIRHFGYGMNQGERWNRTESSFFSHSYFDAEKVKSIADRIAASQQAKQEDKLPIVDVHSAQEHGDYHFDYQQGRSVVVFPQ